MPVDVTFSYSLRYFVLLIGRKKYETVCTGKLVTKYLALLFLYFFLKSINGPMTTGVPN